MRVALTVFAFILLILAIILIALALLLGLALGVGWVLTLLLPFSLWEGTVLGMIAWAIIGVLYLQMNRAVSESPPIPEPITVKSSTGPVPPVRIVSLPFDEEDTELTWTTWFVHLFARGIRERLGGSPGVTAEMSDRQLQELTLRIATAAVQILQEKSPQTKQLRVTRVALKRQISRTGTKPYNDATLDLAAKAINEEIDVYSDELHEIIRDEGWADPAESE